MSKCQNSNATFWVIFKQCDAGCSKKSWPNSNMYLFLAVDGNFSTANRLCHCLAIPKGKWFSMLITSCKNENVAVVTSFMTSTIQQKFHSPRLAIQAHVAAQKIWKWSMNPLFRLLPSGWGAVASSHDRKFSNPGAGQELCKITRDEL